MGLAPARVRLRPSGPQSLACEGAVLAGPAAPVASAAPAHAEDLLSSPTALLPPALVPIRTMERRVTIATWHRTPEYPARVESRTYWACFWLPLSSTLARTQGRGRSWPRTAAPCPGTQGPDRLRAPVPSLALPAHLSLLQNKRPGCWGSAPVKLRLRSGVGEGQGRRLMVQRPICPQGRGFSLM